MLQPTLPPAPGCLCLCPLTMITRLAEQSRLQLTLHLALPLLREGSVSDAGWEHLRATSLMASEPQLVS